MKVVSSCDDELVFNNGLSVYGWHDQNCCECNYIDFEQFQVGDEFPDVGSAQEFLDKIELKGDGFIFKDVLGIPKWAQARSEQNGYYSWMVGIEAWMNGECAKTEGEVLCGVGGDE